jgi:hypothetical protein
MSRAWLVGLPTTINSKFRATAGGASDPRNRIMPSDVVVGGNGRGAFGIKHLGDQLTDLVVRAAPKGLFQPMQYCVHPYTGC